ncbi:MAG: 4-hydroxy-tetrahydrodipicolinate synthase [Bacteroidales bacterium]|nr:4-hydroxy-tetrahydrodipicolinate synthase [Bacteroidales bacterium]
MINNFKGIGVDLVTPFHKDGNIDFKAFETLINHTIENNCHYIVVHGSVSEREALSKDERNAVLDFVIDTVDKRVPIVAGISANNTQKFVNMRESFTNGIDAVITVVPYFVQPSQKGIYIHFKTIANVCPYPIIILNAPEQTGVNIEPETVQMLYEEVENIIGLCNISGNYIKTMQIIKNTSKGRDFLVLCGNDLQILPLMSAGAGGAISPLSNAYSKLLTGFYYEFINNNLDKAREMYFELFDVIKLAYQEGVISGVKVILERMNLIENNLRLPLVKMNKIHYKLLNDQMDIFEKKLIKSKTII